MNDNPIKIGTSNAQEDGKSLLAVALPHCKDNTLSSKTALDTDSIGGETDETNTLAGAPDNDAPPPTPGNLDDIEADKNYISYEQRVQTALENNPVQPCSRDAKTDEKISKYSAYACIPFFIIGIIITIFDKAKYRSPWSILMIGLAVFVLAIGAFMRYRNNKKCACSVCDTQGKTLRSSAILWGLLTVACMIGFVAFLIINLKA